MPGALGAFPSLAHYSVGEEKCPTESITLLVTQTVTLSQNPVGNAKRVLLIKAS